MTGDAQQPDKAGGLHAGVVVIGDDEVVVADPREPHPLREVLRVGQRVSSLRDARRPGQPAVDLDEHGARQMRLLVVRLRVLAVGVARQATTDVHEHGFRVVGQPARIDDGRDHLHSSLRMPTCSMPASR